MAYDEGLADRVRAVFGERANWDEIKMFGGIAFMVRGSMVVGVVRDDLMARVGPEQRDEAIAKPGARLMDFSRNPMKGLPVKKPRAMASARSKKPVATSKARR